MEETKIFFLSLEEMPQVVCAFDDFDMTGRPAACCELQHQLDEFGSNVPCNKEMPHLIFGSSCLCYLNTHGAAFRLHLH